MSKKQPLTRKRLEWAQRREGEFNGKPLPVNVSTVKKYNDQLQRMIDDMVKGTLKELERAYKTPQAQKLFAEDALFTTTATRLINKLKKKYLKWFDERADAISDKLGKGVEESSKSSLHSSLMEATGGLSLKTGGMSSNVKEVVSASVKQSSGLIKSIPRDFFERVEGTVMRSVQNPDNDMATAIVAVKRQGNITKRRAMLIAKDQTSKATTAVNAARMKDLGIKKFKWLHSYGGKEPRKLHVSYNGQIFDLDNPPIIDEKTRETGLPGTIYHCRCKMIPVITYGQE